MGYRTYHTVTTDPAEASASAIQWLMTNGAYQHEEAYTGEDDVSWYDEPEDMKQLSLEYPDVVFRVDGIGDGQGDIWVHWYKNGHQQVWSLEYAIPDEPPKEWEC